MLIYEKNNKLNINFDNEVSEQPDLQISKEDGKTSVKIDGQESGGVFMVTMTEVNGTWTADKTIQEIIDAINNGKQVYAQTDGSTGSAMALTGYHIDDRGIEESFIVFNYVVYEGVSATVSQYEQFTYYGSEQGWEYSAL
jgi:hypothetical protein